MIPRPDCRRKRLMRARFLVASALIVALDQWTKLWIERVLEPHERLEVVPGFFNLVHVQNTGIAFGTVSSRT